MTVWAIISIITRWLGFIRWADGLWEKHEAAKKAKEAKDAATDIDRMSDDDVDMRLRSDWIRKDT